MGPPASEAATVVLQAWTPATLPAAAVPAGRRPDQTPWTSSLPANLPPSHGKAALQQLELAAPEVEPCACHCATAGRCVTAAGCGIAGHCATARNCCGDGRAPVVGSVGVCALPAGDWTDDLGDSGIDVVDLVR